MTDEAAVRAFWDLARFHAKLNTAPSYFGPTTLEVVPPPAWSFGAHPEQADALLIVGSNPRKEASVLNARIRKRWRAGKLPVGLIGEKADLTYPYEYLGAGPETLADLASGKSSFSDVMKKAAPLERLELGRGHSHLPPNVDRDQSHPLRVLAGGRVALVDRLRQRTDRLREHLAHLDKALECHACHEQRETK